MTSDDELKPFTAYEQGPPTEVQLKQVQHGMGKMLRTWTGNPVGYVEYGGQMLPYPSIYTGERMQPAEHATLMELYDLERTGVQVLPPEGQMGDPGMYNVGSGAQFRQANVSLVGSIQKATQQGMSMMSGEEIGNAYRGMASQAPLAGYSYPPGDSTGAHVSGVSSQSQLPPPETAPAAEGAKKLGQSKKSKKAAKIFESKGQKIERDFGAQAAYERTTRRGF
jgi:hypothetical protein